LHLSSTNNRHLSLQPVASLQNKERKRVSNLDISTYPYYSIFTLLQDPFSQHIKKLTLSTNFTVSSPRCTLLKMASHAAAPPTGGSPSASSAQAAAAARLARMALQLAYNIKTAKYFGIAMASLIVLFTISHWSRFLYSRYSSKDTKKSWIMRSQVSVTRYISRALFLTSLTFAELFVTCSFEECPDSHQLGMPFLSVPILGSMLL
jgi:hypothetical protein